MLQKQKKQVSIITGSLLSIFAILALFNQKIVNQNELMQVQLANQQARGIASIGSLSNDSMQKAMQEKLLSDVKRSLSSSPVLLGEKPSKKEEFVQATLGGNYRLEEKDGSIRIVSLNETKYIVDNTNAFALEFMNSVLAGDFKEVKVLKEGSYQITKQDGSLAHVDIRLDSNKHLESIQLH